MNNSNDNDTKRLQSGKVGYALLWLLGIPIPVLLGIFFLRGCN
jgi:hypothetical protein